MSRLRAFAAVTVVAFLSSCGSAQRTSAPMATSPESILGPSVTEAHQEIDTLMKNIDDELAANGQQAIDVDRATASTMSSQDLQRRCDVADAATGTCGDICVLGTSVCSNALRICDLAGELPGDDWAAKRCNAASASCSIARSRCCSCSGGLFLMP